MREGGDGSMSIRHVLYAEGVVCYSMMPNTAGPSDAAQERWKRQPAGCPDCLRGVHYSRGADRMGHSVRLVFSCHCVCVCVCVCVHMCVGLHTLQ